MPAIQVKDDSDIHFFGSVDCSKDGKQILAEYPSWYFDNKKADLEDDIMVLERQIESRQHENATELREDLRRKKGMLEAINQATPKLPGLQKDKIAKAREEIGERIAAALYSKAQRKEGYEEIEEEARRMMTPCLHLSPELRGLAAKANVPMSKDGDISRNGAEKIWKMMSKMLGESTNVELLRRA